MNVIEPPYVNLEDYPDTKIFLGGGIGECPDWQQEFIDILGNKAIETDFTIINPRWEYKWTSLQQIQWEYNMLKKSDMVIMWFASGGQNRIVFYELGMWINSQPMLPAFIGCDPDFDRKDDVVIQTHLARPDLTVYTNLDDLAGALEAKLDNS